MLAGILGASKQLILNDAAEIVKNNKSFPYFTAILELIVFIVGGDYRVPTGELLEKHSTILGIPKDSLTNVDYTTTASIVAT